LPQNVNLLEKPPSPGVIDPSRIAEKVAFALEEQKIPYAIGGALACGCWMPPRFTRDVDLNVFLEKDQVLEVLEALGPAGFAVTRADLLAFPNQDFLRGYLDGMKVEIFFVDIPLIDEAKKRKSQQSLPYSSNTVWVHSADVMIVFKMFYLRSKDIADIEKLVFTQQDKLDKNWILRELVETFGTESDQVREWARIVGRYGNLSCKKKE